MSGRWGLGTGRLWAIQVPRKHGRLSSMGETSKPRRVPKDLQWVPPLVLSLRVPEYVQDYLVLGDMQGVNDWLAGEADQWKARHLALDPSGTVEMEVSQGDRSRVTLRWRPGGTEPHPSPTRPPSAFPRTRGAW